MHDVTGSLNMAHSPQRTVSPVFLYRKTCSYEVQSQEWITHTDLYSTRHVSPSRVGARFSKRAAHTSCHLRFATLLQEIAWSCEERPLRSFAVEFCGRVLCTLAATARMTVRILPPRCPKVCTQLFAATKIQRSTFWAVEVTKSERRACVKPRVVAQASPESLSSLSKFLKDWSSSNRDGFSSSSNASCWR